MYIPYPAFNLGKNIASIGPEHHYIDNNSNNKSNNTAPPCPGLCSVDSKPMEIWLLPSIDMQVFSGRKRRIFGTHVPFRNKDLALMGIFLVLDWIVLCCGLAEKKKKLGGEWPMHVTGKNTYRVLVQVCWVTMTMEMERLRKDHSSCPSRVLCASWPP